MWASYAIAKEKFELEYKETNHLSIQFRLCKDIIEIGQEVTVTKHKDGWAMWRGHGIYIIPFDSIELTKQISN